ncbi:MAG: hypothetical protein ACXVFQ_06240 [Solirubrobacteraceae bacterium]
MTVSGVGAAAAVALLQGALVALPRGDALGSLQRLRSPAWAAVLPGAIVVGTVAPLGVHPFALGLILMGTLATPPLAAVAALSVVRGPRAGLLAVTIAAGVLATLAGGWSGALSTTVLTAFGALAVGSALARLIPGAWVVAGIACMCAVDVVLLAMGVAQPAAAVVSQAAGHVHGPVFDSAHVGGLELDYPDLMLAAALGGFVAGQRGQLRAAALVSVLAAVSIFLTPVNTMFPATIPAAVTMVALRSMGLPRRPEVRALAPPAAAPQAAVS